jgi:cytochrome o ubiquinol oxidase subunit IV
MNASTHDGHGHGHGHGGSAHPHVTRTDYLIGFVLAAILTAIPFWLVMDHVLSGTQAGLVVMALAAVQVVVHMVYFLHMNSRSQGGYNMLALLFTLVVVGIVITGSLWVMHHLNVDMMQMTPEQARQAP